jgi:hypothetical protein
MSSSIRNRRRWRAGLAATAGLALIAAGTAAANAAAAPTAPLSFITATKTVDVERFVFPDGDSYLNGNLGTYLVAGKDPFEIRVTRKSYAAPIVANQIVVKSGKKTTVKLPAGMVDDFTSGLRDFTTFTVKDSTGKAVYTSKADYCPNSYDGMRSRPDAPDQSPYPQGCGSPNPFLLGSVWGIQAGWTSTFGLPTDIDLRDGTYTTTIALNKKYADFFKISAGKSSVTVTMNLKTTVIPDEGDGGGGVGVGTLSTKTLRAAKAAGVDTGHQHADEGDPSKQVSAFSSDLRPPTKRPKTLAATAIPKSGPRPDLRSLPAWGIQLSDSDGTGGGVKGNKYLTFSATVWNAGTSPLVVDGFRRTGTELMDAYQYYYDAKGKQVGSSNAGTMEWDKREGHKHWHFTDFAQYRLLGADKKLVVNSSKEAFCLVNTDAVDYTVPNAKWRPSNTDLSSSCGQNSAVAVREVLDIGNGDTYQQYLPGQSFDITKLKNGTYYIEVMANPSSKLSETSTKNNSSLRQVILSGSGADRKVTVPAVHGIDGPVAKPAQ